MTSSPDLSDGRYSKIFDADTLPKLKYTLNNAMVGKFQTDPSLAHIYSNMLSAIDQRDLELLSPEELNTLLQAAGLG